jgi:methylated-DNA-[protein]-cysteine S-methyltransferase
MKYFTTTFPTPFGPFSVALDAKAALVATAFGPIDTLRERLLSGGRNSAHRAALLTNDKAATDSVREQVLAYCAGELRRFSLTLAPRGTPFQTRVWSALREIPFGETRSYRALAAQTGNPAASRAVGRANATNPICLIVPCHRVIGADGSLTGFAFGEELKRRLLEHESTALPRSHAA